MGTYRQEAILIKAIIRDDILRAFEALPELRGGTVMAHTSLGSMGYVVGGAQTVLEALLEAVGPEGTVMMPTQSWKNLDPEEGVHWDCDPADWQLIRENWPAYDKRLTPTNTMGAVAELFRQWPGSIRSDHPARSVCAWGRYAEALTRDHDLSNIFGDGSPLSRLYDLDGYSLLIGVGYDKCTALHLADARAEYPSKHNYTAHSAVTENGKRVWKAYDTLFVDGEDFIEIGKAFEEAHEIRRVTIGSAEVKLIPVRALVDFAVTRIEEYRG